MGTAAEREGVRDAVRRLLAADRQQGALKDLNHYKNLFPGFWDVVGEEYGAVAGATRAGGASAESGPAATATTPGPGGVAAEAAPGNAADRIGPYRIVRELGRGGMGVVYEAHDTRLSRRVALKVLSPQFVSSTHLRLRFQREAELASKLDHPHICTVYEAGEDDGTPYLAMRFVEGRTLAEFLALSRDQIRTSGVVVVPPGEGSTGVPWDAAKEKLDTILVVFEKTARGLHYAHEKGLIHRDIKPHNIMVTPDGEPVLLDFGLAREEAGEGHQLTQTGSLMGTPAYMSPEQLMAQKLKLDRRTDVYSLGVSLYECLTLKLPFEAPTVDRLYQQILSTDPEALRSRNPALPRDLEVVTATAMEKDRDRRYGTARDFAEDLRRVRALEPIHARPVGRLLRLRRWAQRNPTLAWTSATLLVCVLSAAVLASVLRRSMEEERRGRADAEQTAAQEREQKTRTETALGDSRRALNALALTHSSRLVLASAVVQEKNAQLSLQLAREALRLDRGSDAGLKRLREALLGWRLKAIIRPPGGRFAVCASPDGDRIVTVSRDLQTTRLWTASGTELEELESPAVLHLGEDSDFVFATISPKGNRVLAHAGPHGRYRAILWDVAGRILAEFGGGERGAMARFSPTGDSLLISYSDGAAVLANPDGMEIRVLEEANPAIAGLGFFLNTYVGKGDRIFTLSGGETGTTWDGGGGRISQVRTGREAPLHRLCFSPDGRLGASADASGVVRTWDLSGASLCEWTGHKGPILSLDWHPPGERLLTGSMDGTARLWDISGKELGTFDPRSGPGTYATPSPDGEHVLTRGGDSTARVWTTSGEEVFIRRGVHSACFSPDGLLVLARCMDKTVRLWKLDGEELAVLSGHTEIVLQASFHEAGRSILTCDGDTARLWSVGETEETLRAVDADGLLRISGSRVTRDYTPEEREMYKDLLGDPTEAGK